MFLNRFKNFLYNVPNKIANYYAKVFKYYKSDPLQLNTEILSGISVGIMQVPESIAFAFIAQISPLIGLYSTFFIGLFTAAFGGRPGMISGISGAMVVVLAEMQKELFGLGVCESQRFEMLLTAIIITGIFQALAGALQIHRIFMLMPQTIAIGFVNGLAIIIFISQLGAFQVDDTSVSNPSTEPPGCPESTILSRKPQRWLGLGELQTWLIIILVAITMAIMYLQPRIKKQARIGNLIINSKIVPASLTSMIVATFIEHVIYRTSFGVSTKIVGDVATLTGDLPTFHVPQIDTSLPFTWSIVFKYGAIVALVALTENLLTLQLVTEVLKKKVKPKSGLQELCAQGFGCVFSGFFQSLGGNTMIGQSVVNILNGSHNRLAGILASFFILLLIAFAGPAIELLPIATLTGILFIVVIHTFEWRIFKYFWRRQAQIFDFITIILVTIMAVLTNLAYAVGAGLLWSVLVFAFQASKSINIETINSKDIDIVIDDHKRDISAWMDDAVRKHISSSQSSLEGTKDDQGIEAEKNNSVEMNEESEQKPQNILYHRFIVRGLLFFGTVRYFVQELSWSIRHVDELRNISSGKISMEKNASEMDLLGKDKQMKEKHVVIIDLEETQIFDFSAIEGLKRLARLSHELNIGFFLIHVHEPSRLLLRKHSKLKHTLLVNNDIEGEGAIEMNVDEDEGSDLENLASLGQVEHLEENHAILERGLVKVESLVPVGGFPWFVREIIVRMKCMKILGFIPVLIIWAFEIWVWYAYSIHMLALYWSQTTMGMICWLLFQLIFAFHAVSYYKVVFTDPGMPPLELALQNDQDSALFDDGKGMGNLNSFGMSSKSSRYPLASDMRSSLDIAIPRRNYEAIQQSFEEQPISSRMEGISRHSHSKSDENISLDTNILNSVTVKRDGTERKCRKCSRLKPDRTHHCSMCRRCILKMDHHCPWINNCVGFYNQKFFILFLFWAVILSLYISSSIMLFGPSFQAILKLDIQSVILLLAGFVFGFVLFFFTAMHIYYVLMNLTTLESLEKLRYRPRVPSNQIEFKDVNIEEPSTSDQSWVWLFGKPSEKSRITQKRCRKYWNVFDIGMKENWIQVMGSNRWLWFVPVFNSLGNGLHFPVNEDSYNKMMQARMEMTP